MYVLHVFQKKSPSGFKTAKHDIELIAQQFRLGRLHFEGESGRSKPDLVRSSGNVFADLRLSRAEEKQTKVRLAVAINQIIQSQRIPQVEAARRLNINQSKISALSNYRLAGFSVGTTEELHYGVGT